MKKTAPWLAILLPLSALATPLFAQQEKPDTLIVNELQPVTVTAYRLETSDLSTPLSLTRIGQQQLQTGTQQLSLDEALMGVPGVFVQNGTNFAQDIRLSIRGFGARSQFGIRGVKILVDGFPESTPDGTAQVDAVDPGSLTGISIIRSGTGGLYGNASGGYVNFSTMKFTDEEWVELGSTIGSYGFHKFQARTGGGKANKFLYSLNGSYTATDGYRDHSAMKNYLVNGGFLMPIDSSFTLRGVVTYVNSPQAQDSGALNQSEVEMTPKAASPNSLKFDTGENLWQLRLGIGLTKAFSREHAVNGSFYQTNRNFIGLIPFDYIALQRSFTGGTLSYEYKSKPGSLDWQLTAGVDLETQRDERKRYQNESGEQGALYADQSEAFTSTGFFVVQKFGLGRRFSILPSVRFDRIHIGVDDRFLADGADDSFEKDYNAFNPMLGLSFLAAQNLHFYLNGSSNFETPTLLEFVTTTDLAPNGINQELRPQKSQTIELGGKMLLANGRVRMEAALFRIWLEDEFIRISALETSRYENAGKSNRKGIEMSLAGQLGKHLMSSFNYTFSDFRYEDYDNYDGNTTPGIPRHQFGVSLQYAVPAGFFFTFNCNHVGELVADDSNDTTVPDFFLANVRSGWRIRLDKWEVEPFFGINNLFNTSYNANIRINAGSRFYEPAPVRNYFGGIKIRF